jgi:organic radical activating enzyme
MSMYRVNDIFYSLQGEGHNTGRAAVFIRFAGCNLRCPFCDTEFDTYREMSIDDILQAIAPYPTRFVVLTGGEPTLQADEEFVDRLHLQGYEVAMESNGTRPAPKNLDWLTVSPKRGSLPPPPPKGRGESLPLTPSKGRGDLNTQQAEKIYLQQADEIKIVFESAESLNDMLRQLPLPLGGAGGRLSLQPCDTGDAARNAQIIKECVDYIMEHPQWRLSLQTHKLINIK